ncbi:MAG TPA: hypothetical protein VHD34_03945 [Xanthobacteraceae bacterium]|nr:hypothetical protein [Xanthobacteraceae bacterium]
MPATPTPAQRLAELRKPSPARSLLRVVGEPKAAALKPAIQPNIDFRELARVLLLAKDTLQEEQARILALRERVNELRGFEDAFRRSQDTIDELRADRDQWRRQAVAMSNRLLSEQA